MPIVADVLSSKGQQVHSVTPSTRVLDAINKMNQHKIGAVLVLHDGHVAGIFTERDVLRLVASGGDPVVETVAAWMTMYPDSFLPDMDVKEAADWMLAAGYRHLPVVEEGALIGMASIKDILWALTGDSVN